MPFCVSSGFEGEVFNSYCASSFFSPFFANAKVNSRVIVSSQFVIAICIIVWFMFLEFSAEFCLTILPPVLYQVWSMPNTYTWILCTTLSADYHIQTREILVLENLCYQGW